jgi:hypothetical protein
MQIINKRNALLLSESARLESRYLSKAGLAVGLFGPLLETGVA